MKPPMNADKIKIRTPMDRVNTIYVNASMKYFGSTKTEIFVFAFFWVLLFIGVYRRSSAAKWL